MFFSQWYGKTTDNTMINYNNLAKISNNSADPLNL